MNTGNNIVEASEKASSKGALGALAGLTTSITAGTALAVKNTTGFLGARTALDSAVLLGAGKGLVGGGLGALVTGLIVKNKAKTEEGKALGKGLAVGGSFGSAVGFAALYPALGPLVSILGGAASLLVLYALLSGNKEEADKIIKDKLGENKSEKIRV